MSKVSNVTMMLRMVLFYDLLMKKYVDPVGYMLGYHSATSVLILSKQITKKFTWVD